MHKSHAVALIEPGLRRFSCSVLAIDLLFMKKFNYSR